MVGFSREAEATGSVYRGYWILETQVRELVSLGMQRGVFMGETFWRMSLRCGQAGHCQGPEEPWHECTARGGKAENGALPSIAYGLFLAASGNELGVGVPEAKT